MDNIENKIREINDRRLIRELIDNYAYCADSRNAEGQMNLFTEDTRFIVYMNAKSAVPSQEINNREGLRPVFENLKTYDATMHFNGQSTVQINGETATGLTYCLAHHLNIVDGKQTLMIATIRYIDAFVKQENNWCFCERKLMVDWIENR